VARLGARAEYHFMPAPPRNGSEQWANMDPDLERFLHLWAINRGVLMTPFHNMALMSPATTAADVDRHTAVFREAVEALFGPA
jgi:glutamate-1-semialdehyde aminotransferase